MLGKYDTRMWTGCVYLQIGTVADFIKTGGEFHEKLRYYQLVKKDSAPWI
jgi:hypothetical protein